MKNTILSGAVVLASLAASGVSTDSWAQPAPGMRGINHIGITVPDMDQAVTFFRDILGCQKAMSFGPFRDDEGTFIQDLLNVHPRAVVNQITMMRCGNGSNIEIFDYSSPDQKDAIPRNSDIGGHHIGFYFDDIAAVKAYFDDKGIRTLLGPLPVQEGPAAGQTILYFFAPWGLQLEAISFPDGMAYEADSDTILWSSRDPSK